MRREGRIPHRRVCSGTVAMREGVTGEVMEVNYISYNKLESEESRSNSSKIRGPARICAHGKAHTPSNKCLSKVKGQRKKRDKSCVMDSRYSDPALVDPELPSSWKARQIAVQLSKPDEAGPLAAVTRLWHQEVYSADREVCPAAASFNGALQSLTDSAHWPRVSPRPVAEAVNRVAAHASPSIPISRPVHMGSSSDEWELGLVNTPSDSSSLCSLPGLLGGGTPAHAARSREEPAAVATFTMVEGDEPAEDGNSDWELLSQSASEWDLISEIDSDL